MQVVPGKVCTWYRFPSQTVPGILVPAAAFQPASIRVAKRRGYLKAIGAVARHLAEATYWMLSKAEPYQEPGSSTEA
jgi:hypothetical protein